MNENHDEARGPWPFVTRRIIRLADGTRAVWSSRHHRKGLLAPELAGTIRFAETLSRCLWMPRQLNWWIGSIFALGSLLFASASVFSLAPDWAAALPLGEPGINAIYFAGSIPFTTAAYLQLFQTANAGEFSESKSLPRRVRIFGWKPHDVGWLSCALQFVGTILFNVNTFDAMIPSLTWFEQNLLVWMPNVTGSILFSLSGYLAFVETCHAWWGWQPRSISWWIVWINLLGCVGFLASALLSFTRPRGPDVDALAMAIGCTLLGAICFLIGSLMMLPEAATDDSGVA